jgi:two-component system LytT family response regulator
MKANKITNYNLPSSRVISITDKKPIQASESSYDSKIILPVLEGFEFVHINLIKYLKADGAYVSIILADGRKVTAAKTLKEMALKMPEQFFLRIHQSYLVNMEYVSKYDKKNSYLVLDGGENVTVSRSGGQRMKEYISNNI